MTSDQSSRKLTRKPVILTAAALIAMSTLGLTLGNMVPFAAAETATQLTIETPYGRAPLSFADIVQKVTPAVVSINVKSDAKVAENDESEGDQVPGMPDLPKTARCTISSSSSARTCRSRTRSPTQCLRKALDSSSRATATS